MFLLQCSLIRILVYVDGGARVSFPESRPDKIREINFKSLNLMAYEKIKIYRNTNCEHSQKA